MIDLSSELVLYAMLGWIVLAAAAAGALLVLLPHRRALLAFFDREAASRAPERVSAHTDLAGP